jgi:enoyl-CoA hydratase/carnithine racemase
VSTSRVLFHTESPAAFVTFNRPEARNAMTFEMYDALVEACERADADPSIRVLVLRGAGGKAFASGTDIAQFTRFTTREDAIGYERRMDAVIDRIERVRAATIAQVQGIAAGGGCMIAVACDFRVCATDARFGVPVARTLGNCLSGANYARLVDMIGPARTRDLLCTGRLMDAAEAAAAGLASRVVAPDALEDAVAELAATLASNAPLTIRATKEALRRLQAHRRPDPAAAEDLIALCYGSDDFRDAVKAFLGKQPPVFQGR